MEENLKNRSLEDLTVPELEYLLMRYSSIRDTVIYDNRIYPLFNMDQKEFIKKAKHLLEYKQFEDAITNS